MKATINVLIDEALDRSYIRSIGPMLKQVISISQSPRSRMQEVLRELDQEAARLEESQQPLTLDNAVLEKVLREYRRTFDTTAQLIRANDDRLVADAEKLSSASFVARLVPRMASSMIDAGVDPLSKASTKKFERELMKVKARS